MCGIAGFIQNGQVFKGNLVPLIWDTLAKRGPDDRGYIALRNGKPYLSRTWSNNDISSPVILTHNRLAILDLSPSGWQPQVTSDQRFAIVFNGEIYNYLELRSQLSKLGCEFKTNSDTEVLLQAYAQWGQECLKLLVGMFAFAIYDFQEESLFLARDFFGIKPLYFVSNSQYFGFCSTIQGLIQALNVKPLANRQRSFDFLRFGLTDEGQSTLFEGVFQVPAAHYLKVSLAKPAAYDLVRYWDVSLTQRVDCSFEEAAHKTRDLFLDSVKLHLRSDVPFGTALSGGLDSSAVCMAIRSILGAGAKIRVFSFIADETKLNEEPWVDLVTKAGKLDCYKVHGSAEALLSQLPSLMNSLEEPSTSASVFAQRLVFELAKSHGITVMLDGQGADEIFGGYDHYLAIRIVELLRRGKLVEALKLANSALFTRGVTFRKLFLRLCANWIPVSIQQVFQPLIIKYFTPSWLGALEIDGADSNSHLVVNSKGGLKAELYRTLRVSILPHLLRYEDRNSMAYSVESRVPFLVPDLVQFAYSLPEEYLLSSSARAKHVFREAMQGIVPQKVLDRQDKIGFAVPQRTWLHSRAFKIETLLDREVMNCFSFLKQAAHGDQIQKLTLDNKAPDSAMWRLISFVQWAKVFGVNGLA